jgi:site-specific DNA recombinase
VGIFYIFSLPPMSKRLVAFFMKACGYLRKSTKDQSEFSLDYQERMIREYCQRHDLEIAGIFKDDGQSSYTFDRPDFRALENFIKKSKDISYLIILNHDRFSRNLAEALMKIHELQSKYNLKVLATSDNFDTDFSDPSNFMIRAFKLMMAESELHNIRKNTRNGMIQAALNGRYSSMAPYGYKNTRDAQDKPLLEIDETKAVVVRKIFRLWLDGADINTIMSRARELGYKQKGNSAIQRILSNPVYCGLIAVPAHKGRKKPYAQGIHAPIISEQDFWMAQEKFSGKKRSTHANEEVFLRGALKCWCGRKVTAGKSRNRFGKGYWYYLCSEHRENMSAKVLHEKFQDLLKELSLPEKDIDWLRTKLSDDIRTKIKGQSEDRARLEKELKHLSTQIKATERRYLTNGNLSSEVFNQVIGEMKAEEVRMQRDLAKAGDGATEYFERMTQLLDRAGNLWQCFQEMPLERQWQFINMVFDQPFYYRNGSYRTPGIHPALSANLQKASDKELLKIESPVKNLTGLPGVPQTGALSNPSAIEWLESMTSFLELIA